MALHSWHIHEYLHKPKTKDWFWTVGIITAALMVTCVIFGNILFAVILAVAVFALCIFSVKLPRMIDVDIDERGIAVDKIYYPYTELESFGIDNEHMDGPRLYLKSKKVVMPLIAVPVHAEEVEQITAHLKNYLKEEHFNQGLLHTLLERLGF
jgi:hypothetical protein